MDGARKAAAALRRDESGLTLVELLIASTLGLVVVGAALAMFLGGVRSEPRTATKVAAIQDARVTLDRVTRELRQGLEVEVASPSQLAIVTYVKAASCGGAAASTSIPCRVTYSCVDDTCSRFVAQPDGSAPGPTTQVVSGLTTPSVFTYLPDATDPTYVGVDFVVASGEDDPVSLGDGVALRNFGEGEA
ncbi:MAG TPA: prepilin-type N-terminal cleavage/methylation domain-containing protein [Solirubrobacterales bacterium]|nr:prepilin-type N-terminal cleavage/methylation domain-containing protein [Solirubrobacterales bacterium]